MSAVRNLAGRELNGRPLRIDSACNAPSGGLGGMGPPGEGPRGGVGPGPGQGPLRIEVHCSLVIYVVVTGRKRTLCIIQQLL